MFKCESLNGDRYIQGGWALEQAVATETRLTEFKEDLDNAPKEKPGPLGCPLQGQELDTMMMTGPFQMSIFQDSVILYIFDVKQIQKSLLI